MNRRAAFILTLSLLSTSSIVTPAQTSPPASPLATVEGSVVDSVTGQPVEGIHVAILEGGQPLSEAGIQSLLSDQRPTAQAPQVTKILPAFVLQGRTLTPERTTHSVITDARGRFAFTGVKAGKYTMAFRGDGYTYQAYGQKADSIFVPPVDIHEGRNDLGNVQLRPEPQVSGRIIDSDDTPIAGVPVYLVKAPPTIGVDGEKSFRAAGETVTDASGSYSLKNIVAGHYYIAAGSFGSPALIRVGPGPGGATSRTPVPAQTPFPYTYYPGVPDAKLAGQINVPAGSKIAVGDMVVAKRELRAIRGRVVDSTTGKPPESVRLVLNGWAPIASAGSDSRRILSNVRYDRATGVFESTNLIPGRYRVDAILPSQPISGQTNGPPAQVPPRSAFQLLELADKDVNDLVLSVLGNGRVTGRVVVSDGKALPVAERNLPIPLQLMLRPLTPLQPAPTVTSVSVQDGTFEVPSALEGKYRFSLVPLRDNYYVSEASLNGVRVVNGILDVPGNVASELVFTLSPGGEIQGMAVDQKGQPVKQARGVVLPDPLPEIIPFYQTLSSDNEGRFFAPNIPPGNYKIYIWDGTEEPQFFDRELLARASALAPMIHLGREDRLATTVTILAP